MYFLNFKLDQSQMYFVLQSVLSSHFSLNAVRAENKNVGYSQPWILNPGLYKGSCSGFLVYLLKFRGTWDKNLGNCNFKY